MRRCRPRPQECKLENQGVNRMKWVLPFCTAVVWVSPVAAAEPQLAEFKLPHSSVSVAVEPQLERRTSGHQDCRDERHGCSCSIRPGSVSISSVAGQPIALSSLQKLINNVRLAAGMKPEAVPFSTPTAGAYAAPQMQVNSAGQADVSNYTGGSAIGFKKPFGSPTRYPKDRSRRSTARRRTRRSPRSSRRFSRIQRSLPVRSPSAKSSVKN